MLFLKCNSLSSSSWPTIHYTNLFDVLQYTFYSNNVALYTASSVDCTILKKNFVVWVVVFDTEKRTNFRLKFVLEEKRQSCPQPKTFGSITIFRVCGALQFETMSIIKTLLRIRHNTRRLKFIMCLLLLSYFNRNLNMSTYVPVNYGNRISWKWMNLLRS